MKKLQDDLQKECDAGFYKKNLENLIQNNILQNRWY